MPLASGYIDRLRANVPLDIQQARRWIVGKGKQPFSPVTGEGKGWNDGEHCWTDLDGAARFAETYGWVDGLGVALVEGDRLILLDGDHVVLDDGDVEPWWGEIRDQCASYTERSMSGRGEHILVRGDWKDGWRTSQSGRREREQGSLEMYGRSRWVRLTGEVVAESPPGIEEAPAGLLERLQREHLGYKPQAPSTSEARGGGAGSHSGRGYAEAALRDEVARVRSASEGCRNNVLNCASFSLGQLVAGGVLDEGQVRAALMAAAASVGLPEPEAASTIRSGMTAGAKEPRTVPGQAGGADGKKGPASGRTRADGRAASGGIDDRPKIIYRQPGGDIPMHELTADALARVAERCPDRLYVRYQHLVRTTHERAPDTDGIVRGDALRIVLAKDAIVGEILGEAAKWIKLVKSKKDDQISPVETWCPAAVEKAFSARGEWPLLRPIVGVTESPTLRPDGSLLVESGYDAATALVLHPQHDYPPVPAAPTREDAQRAAEVLLGPFSEFSFETEHDRASLVALMLTIAARFSIAGHVPLWLALAPCFRAGKGLLVQCATVAMTGRLPDLMPPPGGRPSDTEAEMRKRVTALLIEGARVAVLDNVPDGSTLRSESLAAVLTADTWTDRRLGYTEIVRVPARTVWTATGVNVSLWGDLAGRSLSVRIDPGVEAPEARTFAIADLRAHVREEHPRLLAAALTLLRAHIVAGSPPHGQPLLGDYEAWDARIRAAIVWATGLDPLATQQRLKADAPDREGLAGIFTAWWERFAGRGRSARQVCAEASSELREAIAEAGCVDPKGKLDTAALGRLLRTAKGRIVGGFRLSDRPGRGGAKVWRLAHLGGAGQQASVAGTGAFDGGDGEDGGDPAVATRARATCDSGTVATSQPSPPSPPGSDEAVDDMEARAEREAIQWEANLSAAGDGDEVHG